MQHRVHTLLNVLGLAVGLAVVLVVVLFLKNELTYDKHVPEHQNIYRLTSYYYFEDDNHHYAPTGLGLAPLLSQQTDAIRDYVRVGNAGKNVLLKHGDQAYYEDQIFYSDSTYFDIFPSEFIYGNPKTALVNANSMVLTRSLAMTIFGDVNPIGEVLRTNNSQFTVTAVIEDLPLNSHVQFKALLPAFTEELPREELIRTLWVASTFTYIRLQPDAQIQEVQKAFTVVHDSFMVDVGKALNSDYDIIPEKLADIHYSSTTDFDLPRGKRSYLYVFSGVGLLILALAMINYVNLTTARASSRSKEMGVRKVLGSTKGDLITQLLLESVVLTFVALFVAVVMVEILLRTGVLNVLLQEGLSVDVLSEAWLIGVSILIALLVGLLSGLYPAIFLSKTQPVIALKGAFKTGKSNMTLRRFLVGFQFTISVSVVVLSLFMGRQMEYMNNRYLGFNREDIILVPVQDTSLREVVPLMLDELRELPYVQAASTAHNVPGELIGRMLMHAKSTNTEDSKREAMDIMRVGNGYFETMEMTFAMGGSFQPDRHTDTTQTIVVNQAAVKYFGWDNPIGQILEWGLKESGKSYYAAEIVGVVKDFNASSLHHEVVPLVLFLDEEQLGTIHIRVDSDHLRTAISSIEGVWNLHQVDRPFEFSFLDSDLEYLYAEDRRQSALISMLTLVTVLISTLGLLGLASYSTAQRYKEIGVRKVLGAEAKEIVQLLFRDIATLVAISVLLSMPISWLVYNTWVSSFAYTSPISWVSFVLIGVVTVLFAYTVVSVHSFRAARANPVESLKYE